MTHSIHSHLAALVGERHPLTAREGLQRAEQYLIERFRGFGWHVSTHAFQALGDTYRNVIADHPHRAPLASASAPRNPPAPLILAAHYDTVSGSPGADDNASGLVVLLDVARRLGEVRLAGPVRIIAFCLEEEDLLGSRAYAEDLKSGGQTIRGALVLECVGYANHAEGSQGTPPGVPIQVPSVGDFLGVIGNQNSAELVTAFERAANQAVPTLKTVSLVVPEQGEMLPDTRRSDHAAFWDQGFPALMLTDTADFRNPHYHRSTDTLDTLDLGFLTLVADAVTASVVGLAGSSS